MRRIERSGRDDTPPGISRTGRRHRWRRFAVLALAPLLALSATGATAQGVWLTLPSIPTARSGHAAATAPCPGGLQKACVYVFGGRLSANPPPTTLPHEFEAYSPASNAWATLAPLPTPREGLAGRGAPCPGRLLDGCVYAIGGADDTGPLDTVEAYSPTTGAWATLTDLPTARTDLAAAKAPCPTGVGLRGTCVYALGGRDASGPLTTVEAYSPATETWATVHPLSVARADLGAVGAPCPPGLGLHGGCVYAIDGAGDGSVEVYSPVTDAWMTLHPLPVSHGDRPAVVAAPCPGGLAGGCVYVAGGSDPAFRAVHAYSPVTDSWITLPQLPTPHRRTAGAVAPCPKDSTSPCVYVVGGLPDNGGVATGATEAFAVEHDPQRPEGPGGPGGPRG